MNLRRRLLIGAGVGGVVLSLASAAFACTTYKGNMPGPSPWSRSWRGRPVRAPRCPPRAQVVDVAMREFGFDYKAPTRPGRTVFRVHNMGREGHLFGVFPLPEDMPPIDVQLHGDRRRSINPVADVPQNLVTLAPGERLAVAVDLVPGRRYAFLDLNDAPDGKNYALSGMNSEFRTPGGTAPPPTALTSPVTGDQSASSTP